MQAQPLAALGDAGAVPPSQAQGVAVQACPQLQGEAQWVSQSSPPSGTFSSVRLRLGRHWGKSLLKTQKYFEKSVDIV
jgi:hypothetical protein